MCNILCKPVVNVAFNKTMSFETQIMSSETSVGMVNLRGLRGSEWVACVGVGCVGRSGLRGSEWVKWVKWVKWFKGKTSFPCIVDILQKEAASCFFYCFEFCSNLYLYIYTTYTYIYIQNL